MNSISFAQPRRTRALQSLGCLLAVLLWVGGARANISETEATREAEPLISSVESIGITVRHLDRSVEFFTQALDFEKVGETDLSGEAFERLTGLFGARARQVRLILGNETLLLTEFITPRGKDYPADSRSNDRWFQHIAIVVSDMGKAYEQVRHFPIQLVSTSPQRLPDWNRKVAGIEAFYFKDLDGHNLELIKFPAGKGNPRWQNHKDGIFLGIDHTAIGVSDTPASRRFYDELLGLKLAGQVETWGTEHEHLNGVFGTRLAITSLMATNGPGIEFLEYIAPATGRPRSREWGANDLVHWQTTLLTYDVDAAYQRLRAARAEFITAAPVDITNGLWNYSKAFLVRDPDGHALLIAQP